MKNKGTKNTIIKFCENTLAYAIPVFMQQFIVYPVMASRLGADKNGLFLSILAIYYFLINITVSVLVNTRLLQNKKYIQKNLIGDFNFLLLIFGISDVVIVLVGTFIYSAGDISIIEIVLTVILMLLFVYHDYIVVQYRIELAFNKILVNNLLLSIGYIIGLAFFYYVFSYWQIVFVVAYLLTFVYDFLNTNYIKEPINVTPIFGDTVKQYFILMGSTLLTTAVTYGDRLLLYPILDGSSVSIFSSAQLIGKMMQMLSTPITTFVLAYLVRKNNLQIKIKVKFIALGICLLGGLYVVCVGISYPMIYFLYPQWAVESLKYVKMTALNGIILMLGVIINVFVLRFCDRRYQIIKSALYLITYLGFSFTLVKIVGLWGFCCGNLIASVVQLVFLVYISLRKKIVRIII